MTPTVRYVLVFIAAAIAAFAALDPVGVPPLVSAGLAAIAAGLAGLGIVPPHADPAEQQYSRAVAVHTGDAESALRYIRDGYPHEPLFVLRGRDRAAAEIIREYAAFYISNGDVEMGDQANDHAFRFEQFAKDYPQLMKYADAYPGWKQ